MSAKGSFSTLSPFLARVLEQLRSALDKFIFHGVAVGYDRSFKYSLEILFRPEMCHKDNKLLQKSKLCTMTLRFAQQSVSNVISWLNYRALASHN